MPGMVTFDPDEIEAINEAQLILLGIQPSEVAKMPVEQVNRVLEIARANEQISAYNVSKMTRK